jgi:hypothetical protein
MANGVDAGMDAVQPAVGEPARNPTAAESNLHQLGARHEPILAPSQRRDDVVKSSVVDECTHTVHIATSPKTRPLGRRGGKARARRRGRARPLVAAVVGWSTVSRRVPHLQSLQRLDDAAYRAFRTTAHTPQRERAVRQYSRLGEHAAVWLITGAIGALLDRPNRSNWIKAASAVAGAYTTNQAIKLAVRRRRPDMPDLPPLMKTPTKLSFPSAHTASSVAAASAYSNLLPRSILYPAATAMALSRLYLGVHYPTDVAAGALLGLGLAELAR